MDLARIWCTKFGEKQLKATLKKVQYNPKSNFNLLIIEKTINEGWKLSSDQEGSVLTKDIVKLVFEIKIMTKNGVVFCEYPCRDHEIFSIVTTMHVTMSSVFDHTSKLKVNNSR